MARGKHRRRADLRHREARAVDAIETAERIASLQAEREEFEARAAAVRHLAADVAASLAALALVTRDEEEGLIRQIRAIEAEAEGVAADLTAAAARLREISKGRVYDPETLVQFVKDVDPTVSRDFVLVDNKAISAKISTPALQAIARRRGGKA